MTWEYKKLIAECSDCPHARMRNKPLIGRNLLVCTKIKGEPEVGSRGIHPACPYNKDSDGTKRHCDTCRHRFNEMCFNGCVGPDFLQWEPRGEDKP